jgi:hypothetical protein
VTISAKAARKCAVHPGGAVLQGRLIAENGHLRLLDAGLNWLDLQPAPVETVAPVTPAETTES